VTPLIAARHERGHQKRSTLARDARRFHLKATKYPSRARRLSTPRRTLALFSAGLSATRMSFFATRASICREKIRSSRSSLPAAAYRDSVVSARAAAPAAQLEALTTSFMLARCCAAAASRRSRQTRVAPPPRSAPSDFSANCRDPSDQFAEKTLLYASRFPRAGGESLSVGEAITA